MTNDPLWAPWRLAYIKSDIAKQPASHKSGKEHQTCFLCDYRDQPFTNDATNYVVQRGEQTLTVLNRYPYNNGHLLIAPREHIATLEEVDDETALEISRTLCRMTSLLKQVLNAQGFNIGLNLGEVAGAGLPGHLHWHIVPRWSGDSNFMTVTADTNVIPQSLTALYDAIQQELNAESD